MKLLKTILISTILATALAADQALDDILGKMSGTDYKDRQEARNELYSLAAEVSAPNSQSGSLAEFTSGIMAALSAKDLDIQGKVFLTRILERIGDDSSSPALIEIALDSGTDPIVREHAAMAVSAIPGKAVSEQIMDALKRASPGDKVLWWQAAQHQMDSSMVNSLIDKLGKSELAINPDAWTALGRIGGSDAAKYLTGLMDKATGTDLAVIERAVLESNACSASQLKKLLSNSADAAVQTGAFAQLLDKDSSEALQQLEKIIGDPESGIRQAAIRLSLESGSQDFWDMAADNLAALTADEVNTFLIAVGEQGRSGYEQQVIGYLSGDTSIPALHTLAQIGTKTSTPALLERMNAEDETVQELAIYALAQVADPELDKEIVARVQDVQSDNREDMIRLMAIRNSDGAIDILNSILKQGADDPAISEILASTEEIGDINSCKILLSRLLDEPKASDLRKIQLTLKRLVINLSLPDHLWENAFHPALLLATNDVQKSNIIEILDCLSTRDALKYCTNCLEEDSPEEVSKAAMAAIRRWTDLSVADYWIKVAKNNDLSDKEIKDARTAITRVISSKSVTGSMQDKANLALNALMEIDDSAFREQVFNTLGSTNNLGKAFTQATDKYRSIIEAWDKLD